MKGPELCAQFQRLLPKFFAVGARAPAPITADLGRLEGLLTQTVARMAQKPQIIFVFTRGQPAEYKEVKRVSDVVLKIPSQCVNCAKQSRGLNDAVLSNLALKINLKLGGVNARLASPLRVAPDVASLMICGADVTHPMSGEKSISVASIVGSLDASHTRYASESTVQQGRQEVIENMRTMMQGLFAAYARANRGAPPAAVVFYRDGVGDQMFDKVLREEVTKIYQAFQDCFPAFPAAPHVPDLPEAAQREVLPAGAGALRQAGQREPRVAGGRGHHLPLHHRVLPAVRRDAEGHWAALPLHGARGRLQSAAGDAGEDHLQHLFPLQPVQPVHRNLRSRPLRPPLVFPNTRYSACE